MTTTPVPAAKLCIDLLGKTYGGTIALQPSSLSIQAGEFLTLLGPSGSGKTTLLQMVAGLVEPSAGRVIIDGKGCTAQPVHQRDIGMVFQHYALFPHLTVGENIAFPLQMRRWKKPAIEAAVGQALGMVKMDHLKERFPRELSGGQQQRIALARCFVYRPSIILMDEPLGALDKNLREHMQVEIMRLHRELKATIVYVTHDQDEALAMSDRICLMNEARIEQVDTPRRLYERPASVFSANFIGESNILEGHAMPAGDGGWELLANGRRIALPGGEYAPHQNIALMIRPERVKPGAAGRVDCINRVSGVVRELIYAGADTKIIMTLEEGRQFIAKLPHPAALPALGDRMELSWAVEDAVVIADAKEPPAAVQATSGMRLAAGAV